LGILGLDSSMTNRTYNVEKFPNFGELKTWKIFDVMPFLDRRSVLRIHNEFAALFGVAGMGFKLYYLTTHQSLELTDFAVRTEDSDTFWKSFSEEYGHINPGIAWGMTEEIIPGMGLRPEVRVDLNFCRWDERREEYNETGGSAGAQVRYGQNKFVLGVDLGLGGLTVAAINGLKMELDLNYGFNIHFWDNEYSYPRDGRLVNKRVKGARVTDVARLLVEDVSEFEQRLFPSFVARWSGDRLGLASRFGLEMNYKKNSSTPQTLQDTVNSDGSLIRNGIAETVTDLLLNPRLDLAMRWGVVPGRFYLNAGGAVRFFQLKFNTEEIRRYENDEEIKSDGYDLITNTFEPARTALSFGVTFNPTANVGFQATLGVTTNNVVNMFHTDPYNGFFNFSNIMVTVKF